MKCFSFCLAVIADLRILEEQQVESVRKLEQARATKQRRLEHQAALEAQLGKLLYENGQRRAELEHVYQQLAQGQREMNELRLHVDKSGDDLRDYDAKLQYALDLKSWIQGYCRTQDRWMERARNKVANRRRRLEVLHGKCKASNGKLQSKREFEESLRRGLRDEANKQRQIAECKTCIRVECAELEKQCHHAIKQVTFLKSTDESLSEKINVEVQRERIGKADFEKQQNTHQSSMLAMSQSKKVTSETTAQNQSDLHDIWLATIAIQEQEGHTPSQSPSLSSQLPILDLNRIRRSVQVEIDAAAKETLAKDLLGDTVTKLQSELVDLETNQACANEELLAKNEKNETSARIEEERKESIDEVLAEHHMIDAKIGEKTLKVRQLQKEKDASLETTRVASLAIAEGVENADIQYQELRTQLSDVQSKMDIAHAEYDHAKLADPKMIFNLQLQLQETSQRRLEIQKETELFQKGHIATAEQQRLREQMEKANRTIADKLEGKQDRKTQDSFAMYIHLILNGCSLLI